MHSEIQKETLKDAPTTAEGALMENGNEPGSKIDRLVRFFDSFLQEQNVKWVLAVGALIVVGSSLRLVGSYWQEVTPPWKYIITLGYTGLFYLASQWTFHRLLLQKTGTVLMGVCVLLFPILFAALGWVGTLSPVLMVVLFIATLGLALPASFRIFAHFLRGVQPTFWVSYVILCAAGSLAPLVPHFWAPVASLVLWLVFTLGSIKVSRHVFWLVEEHRQPRIFGFAPIAFLGAQFLLVFGLNFAAQLPLQWFGLGCALVAVPVLLTTDRLARVFQLRTGDLIRPLPAAIIVPLVVALLLCVVGLGLAATGITSMPYAVAPTAVLVAVTFGLVARRTHKESFVWGAMLSGLIAYNFSPTFFATLARQWVQSSASAVAEEKLPYAFYGLTYLPVIAVLVALAGWAARRGWNLVERPTRILSLILSVGLLVVSLSHSKAVFPVAATMTAALAAQLWVFRIRILAVVVQVAAGIAIIGFALFAPLVLSWDIGFEHVLVMFVGLGWICHLIGLRVDPWLAADRSPEADADADQRRGLPFFAGGSFVMTVLSLLAWSTVTPLFGRLDMLTMVIAVAAIALLVLHSVRWRSEVIASVALASAVAVLSILLALGGAGAATILTAVTLSFVAMWAVSYLLGKQSAPSMVLYGGATALIGSIGLGALLLLVHVPFAVTELAGGDLSQLAPLWLRIVVVGWSFDAARRTGNSLPAYIGTAALYLLCGAGAALAGVAAQWQPLVLVGVSVIMLTVVRLGRQLADNIKVPLERVTFAVLVGVAASTLVFWTLPLRAAGLAAAAALWARYAMNRRHRDWTLVLSEWQLVACALALPTSADAVGVLDMAWVTMTPALLPVALVATGLRIFVPVVFREQRSSDLLTVHRVVLGVLSGAMMLASFELSSLNFASGIMAGVVFALLTFEQLWRACVAQKTWRVWAGQTIAGLGILYFIWFGVIHFGSGRSMVILLGVALAMWIAAREASKHAMTAILAEPLQKMATALPTVTAVIGLVHFIQGRTGTLDYPAMLLAAGFYFWRGLETQGARFLLLSAAIFNGGLMMLCRNLALTDPQFYMIPIGVTVLVLTRLLREELPERFHDPLYYAGALMILVSPTFHIVGGSWLHLFTLMVASVSMVFVAIGLRLRPLMYAGAAFLIADLVAMVVRGSVDRPHVLWIAGLLLGAMVVTIGALAERNREKMLQRIRMLSAELQTWS